MATSIETPTNATIVVTPAKRTQAPRGKRVPVASVKARETQETRKTRRGTRAETLPPLRFRNIEDSDGDYEDDDQDISHTLEELVGLVKCLKRAIDQQNSTIKDAQNELKELKEEQQIVKTQNTELQDEVRMLRGQVSALSASLPSTQSWASVVAGSNKTQAMSVTPTSLRQASNEQMTLKEANCVRISTAPQQENATDEEVFTRYLSTKAANRHIQDALRQSEPTNEVKVIGVGTTKTGYVVRFADPETATKAKTHPEWLQNLGNTTKLVKPRFPVVAHRFPTTGMDLDNNKQQVIDKIMEENDMKTKDFKIDDIRWFKPAEKPLGMMASLGIWFDTAEAAKWTEMNGLVCDQRHIGSVEAYRMEKKRCHRCQKLGHLAWPCKEKTRCKHCSGEHDRRECPPGTGAKCSDCDGPHRTGSQGCPGPVIPRTRQ